MPSATASRRSASRAGSRQLLGAGPWDGVFDSLGAFDDTSQPNKLQDAQNVYITSDVFEGPYARPGFVQTVPTFTTATTTGTQGSALFTMTAQDGTVYRFLAVNGKLFRLSGTGFSTSTDVTPVGVTISNSSSPTARFYMTSYANQLVFSDGVLRPWLGTNLGATPITGTYIDIDGAAGAWTAQGPPVIYGGSLFFLTKTVPGGVNVQAGVGMVWCEPGTPAVGYCQAGYADFWNLIQTSSNPIYLLVGTNTALYYFREFSIGAVSGIPNVNFSTTATHDVVSRSIGTNAPGSATTVGETIFFCDNIGRPFRLIPGEPLEELWKQLKGQIDTNPSYIANPTATALVGVSSYIPQLNCVLLAGWASNPAVTPAAAPTTGYLFDAQTGTYYGRWSGASTLSTFDSMAVMKDSTNATVLCIFSISGLAGRVWLLSLLSANVWKDTPASGSAVVPTITAKTQRLGYSAGFVWNADMGVLIALSLATVTVTVQTPYTSSTTEITSGTPNASSDSTYRLPFGMDVQAARGFSLTAQPTTATSQWALERIEMSAVPCLAGVDDQ